jgi:hypothetical protein
LLFCFIVLAGSAGAGQAPAADKIIRQATKALGGEKALRRMRTRQARGIIMRARDGATGRFEAAAMQPGLYALGLEIGGFETSAGFNGRSSWRRDSRDGARTLTGAASRDFQDEAHYRAHRWLDYKKDRSALTYTGQERIQGRPAHAVVLATQRNVRIKMFFDAASRLLVKEEIPAGEGMKIFEYANYRPVGGVMEPFTVIYSEAGERYEIKLDQIVHNQPLDRARFDFPRVSNEPLLEVTNLLNRVRRHQRQLDQLREKYTYTETITSRQLDKNGVLKETESETYNITFYRGHRIRRLVAKKGQPLAPGDEAKEARRIEQLVQDIEQGKKIDIPYNQRRLRISDLLRISRFVNPRRERFRQRDVIVFDFEPNPGFKPANYDEQFYSKIAGSLWVDVADLQVARVEFYLVGAFKVGGGAFFAMLPGARFVGEQDRFNNEIWLPTYSEVTFSARAMIFARFGINQTTAYGHYARFKVESEEKLRPPVVEETKKP